MAPAAAVRPLRFFFLADVAAVGRLAPVAVSPLAPLRCGRDAAPSAYVGLKFARPSPPEPRPWSPVSLLAVSLLSEMTPVRDMRPGTLQSRDPPETPRRGSAIRGPPLEQRPPRDPPETPPRGSAIHKPPPPLPLSGSIRPQIDPKWTPLGGVF